MTDPSPTAAGPDPVDVAVGLSGAVVSAESVTFTDSQAPADARRRIFAMSDIANVGFAQEENPIVVRTRQDGREVGLWMASAEDARALLELLPRTTTPEFLERLRHHRRFRENLAALAPRTPVTITLIGLNVALFLVMLAAGAWFLSKSLRRIDGVALRLSSGRSTFTSVATGLPTIVLVTTGARSGRPSAPSTSRRRCARWPARLRRGRTASTWRRS